MMDEIEQQLREFVNGKKKQKTVKIIGKNFYRTILADYHSGLISTRICEKHNISKQRLYYYRKDLVSRGLMTFDPSGFGVITQKGKLFLMNEKPEKSKRKKGSRRYVSDEKLNTIHVHGLRVKFPLVADSSKKFWVKESDFGYSGKKYYHYHSDFTIVKNGRSSIEVMLDFFVDADNSKEFSEYLVKILDSKIKKAVFYLDENGIEINYSKRSVSNIEYAIRTPFNKDIDWSKVLHEQLDLKTIRDKIFKGDKDQRAIAKVDRSHHTFESNHKTYGDKVLDMPETIDQLSRSLIPTLDKLRESNDVLAENMKTHVSVMQEIRDGLSEFRSEIRSARLLGAEEINKEYERVENMNVKDLTESIVCPSCGSSYSKKLYACPKCHKETGLNKFMR